MGRVGSGAHGGGELCLISHVWLGSSKWGMEVVARPLSPLTSCVPQGAWQEPPQGSARRLPREDGSRLPSAQGALRSRPRLLQAPAMSAKSQSQAPVSSGSSQRGLLVLLRLYREHIFLEPQRESRFLSLRRPSREAIKQLALPVLSKNTQSCF